MTLKRGLFSLGAWLLVGLVFSTQLYLFALRSGGRMGWREALMWELPRWILWALLSPIVLRIGNRYPLRRDGALRVILFHTLFGAALSLVHMAVFVPIFHAFRLLMGQQGSLLDTFQFAFALDFHVGIAVYWLILLVQHSRESEQRVSKLQAELMQAQLQALKMQLHPHFLFNTLNSISAYLRTDVEIADEMIGRLGDFLRLTLQNPGTGEIELEKELEFLRRYLEIEELRFQDRLQTKFDIDPETLPALVPNFILQPIVENAVRHAVAMQSTACSIRITSKRLNGKLEILVCDDGPGFPEPVSERIGMSTTRNRLRHTYGDEGYLDLRNRPEGGVMVTIRLPFHVER